MEYMNHPLAHSEVYFLFLFPKEIVFTDYKNINLYIDSLDTLFSSEISLALWLNSNIFTMYGQQNKTEHVNMVQGLQ